ncbi:MAG: ROK family protein, partial [Dehalococcoidales bacterium]|nr:ROK family protein [Dehalococcoidales bacterium]
MKSTIAVDLGGTKIAVGIISSEYQFLAKEYYPTLAEEGVTPVIERVISAIQQTVSWGGLTLAQLDGVTIAAAGAIDLARGIITLSPNLPGWRNIPLRNIVGERLDIETRLINDTNAAALGEHRLGVGRGVSNLIYLTLGTGIGGAIIIDGKLYTGASGSAGELGHMAIDINGP